MPLSKKRQAEYMRNYRKTVIPSVIPNVNERLEVIGRILHGKRIQAVIGGVIPKQAWEITNWAEVDIEANPHLKAHIPTCPDGGYRDV